LEIMDTSAMGTKAPPPLICVTANAMESADRRRPLHATGVRNVESLLSMVDCIPVLLPPVGAAVDIVELVSRMDGFVLPGGRANVEPHHYNGPDFPADEPIDPGRDAIVLPLVRACIAAHVPVLGICRGIQEINVALGGSLHYRIHQVPGKSDHRRPQREDVTQEEVFRLNHVVRLAPGGLFERLTGHNEMMVNSLHGQGVDRLGDGLVVEATSPDGVVEGLRYNDDTQFIVGVQWHAEWQPETHELSAALYRAFGEAARKRAGRRLKQAMA
jgi:putative glutamine amidotransferase